MNAEHLYILVDEKKNKRQLIQTSDIMVPNLTQFAVNIPVTKKKIVIKYR